MEMVKLLLEQDINDRIVKLFEGKFLSIQKSRILPAEFDIVLLDTQSLLLINIEIKRNNWKSLIEQALRGLVYCHFSVAALPISLKKNLPLKEIEKLGIGVLFYDVSGGEFNISLELAPKRSKVMNRSCKKLMYDRFVNKYGNSLYA